MNVWEGRKERFELEELRCYRELKRTKWLERSLGTLGGGNHFIEVDEAVDGTKYLIIQINSQLLINLCHLLSQIPASTVDHQICGAISGSLHLYKMISAAKGPQASL